MFQRILGIPSVTTFCVRLAVFLGLRRIIWRSISISPHCRVQQSPRRNPVNVPTCKSNFMSPVAFSMMVCNSSMVSSRRLFGAGVRRSTLAKGLRVMEIFSSLFAFYLTQFIIFTNELLFTTMFRPCSFLLELTQCDYNGYTLSF